MVMKIDAHFGLERMLMFNHNKAIAILAAILFVTSTGFSQVTEKSELEKNWGEFIHYTAIKRLDAAKEYAKAILDNEPDPVKLFELCQENQAGYQLLVQASDNKYDAELAELSKKLLAVIEGGGFEIRTKSDVIYDEVLRLNGDTPRARQTAIERLKNAGEYAIPFMIDALSDPDREDEFARVADALSKIGRDAIRPLAAALQTDNAAVKSEVVKAMGGIGYPQALPYLKYVIENEQSSDLRQSAQASIMKINPSAVSVSAAELFYQLAEKYYNHAQSLEPAEDAATANVWFWDTENDKLVREAVSKDYFNELMAMRNCEWSLMADESYGSAIGLWIASFFKAESAGVESMPEYFGESHANALVYATTAGVEYLHQALARAVKDGDTFVALGVIEALGRTAGEKSLFYHIGTQQPLVQALRFKDRLVRYSAAIAIGAALPRDNFEESKTVTAILAEALASNSQTVVSDAITWNENLANSYAMQAATVMLGLAQTRNPVIDLSLAQEALINATSDERKQIQALAAQILAYLKSPTAQNAIVIMAFDENNELDMKIVAFNALTISAKLNASMLSDDMVNMIYELISSDETEASLKSAAAAAYGALNLPSRKVKDLILDQSKS
ncbi:MAG: HEAT repeat domain-containing protein [Sedimentisphaerales bacterium]|nr:HEAT repeat domain-containing protein [Sedimentisphaerales bacterium]